MSCDIAPLQMKFPHHQPWAWKALISVNVEDGIVVVVVAVLLVIIIVIVIVILILVVVVLVAVVVIVIVILIIVIIIILAQRFMQCWTSLLPVVQDGTRGEDGEKHGIQSYVDAAAWPGKVAYREQHPGQKQAPSALRCQDRGLLAVAKERAALRQG